MVLKHRSSIIAILCIMVLILTACSSGGSQSLTSDGKESQQSQVSENNKSESASKEESSVSQNDKSGDTSDLISGSDNTEKENGTEGDDKAVAPDITGELVIKAEESDAVSEEGNKYVFSKGGEYHIKGTCGNRMIYIDAKDQDLDIHLEGVTMTSEIGALIFVENAEEVTISATEGTNNELSDNRPARTNKKEDAEFGNAAIYSKDDLKFKGRGRLTVNGSYNNGIGCKNDIKIKNLTLTVNAQNNGIKGNDSVTIESGNITVTAVNGTGIKTENTHISNKGNQKGYITITGGKVDITSADDPIDAAFDLILDSQNAVVTTNK